MQKIRIDFDNPGLPQHISAVENDSQSRFFQATLYENGKAYTAPEGATYSIMYHGFGPQNQGWYDTINDGAGKRAACAVSGNVVTCEIARQALQVPGHVSIVLCVTTGKGYMLKSWPIECDCKNDRYDSTAEIQSFFYITQVSNEDWNRAIQALEELKNTIDPTLSVEGKAADAKATGAAVDKLEDKKADKTDLETERKRIDVLNDGGLNLKDEVIDTSIKTWLTEHPEATTTVQNHSLTIDKMVIGTLGYVTPQMFGAKGDGVADDTNAIQSTYDFVLENFYASANEYSDIQMQVLLPKGSYKVTKTIHISPFVKTKTNGFVRILSYVNDVCIVFAHDSNSLDFLKIDNERFYQKGNAFDCQSGCVHIENMNNNDSIAFQIGGNNDDNFKKTYSLLKFDGISIAKFEIGFSIKSHRMYLTEFNNCIVRKCKKGFCFDNTNYDSGENIKIANTTFGACGHAIELKSTVIELIIYGCSFDFCQGVIYIDNSDGIQGRRFVTIDSCHVEGLGDKNYTSNFIGDYPFISEYVTKNINNYNIPVISVVNTILMGHSYINYQNLFRGKQKLALKTLYFYFTQSYSDDNFNVFLSSFYLCDDNVIILENNVEYVDNFYIVPCSKSLNINGNSRFENTDVVESMTTNAEYKGIKITSKAAILNVSITEEINFKSGKSLCLSLPTLSDGISKNFYMNAEIGTYDVKAGQRIINSIAFKLNNIDKTVSLYTVTKFYDLENKEIAVKNKTSESNRRRTTGDWQRPYYLESCIAPEGSVKCVVTLSSSNSSGMQFSNADKLYISNLETYIN